MRRAVLVNGVPASGKSTIAAHLVRHLSQAGVAAVPLSLDVLKEALYAHLGTGARAHNRLLGRASYHGLFASIAAFPDHLVPVIDAWHGFVPAAVLREHVAEARIETVIEVWCQVSPAVAADRYRSRAHLRHAGHPPASYSDELRELAHRARPIGLGPVLEIDTEAPDSDDMLAAVLDLLQPG